MAETVPVHWAETREFRVRLGTGKSRGPALSPRFESRWAVLVATPSTRLMATEAGSDSTCIHGHLEESITCHDSDSVDVVSSRQDALLSLATRWDKSIFAAENSGRLQCQLLLTLI